MKTVKDIRSEFLGFFEKQGHTVVESSPLVPQNDPTLMFTNSGMVQFKNVFTGVEKRPYKRATTAQKCVRAGGKHNDLDNVGYTARHHTFFEMLGNFSFGDYFKDDAIAYTWELLTKNFALNPDKLLITVHSTDEEAAAIWRKVSGFSDNKIIRIDSDDNFWRMGDTGPCGPSTEIFFDHGDHIWGGPPGSPEQDGDRFIEIWNNVFMQYEQVDPETRIDLPSPCIDTGMGVERIAATFMGSHDNYAIDIMRGLIEHSAELTGTAPDGSMSASHRVIADHLRCASFLLADGVMPSNEGRGYVLRRIMRRGMRHAHLLGAKEPLMHKLFPTLQSKMGEAYPEIVRAGSLITETLRSEEERFRETLVRGLKILEEETSKLSSGQKFPGDVAFKLYDTFGFPLDLTQDALKAQDIAVDTAEFDACMAEQKLKARSYWKGSGDTGFDKLWFDIADKIDPTEFLGYDHEEAEAEIKYLVSESNNLTPTKGMESPGVSASRLIKDQEGIIIVNQSPFYAESGGQVGDTGTIINTSGGIFNVTATRKILGKVWAHYGKVSSGEFSVEQTVKMSVDSDRRAAIKSNHSVTHLLHEALRETLGDHVAQKGSLQDAERTRFDVSHNKAVTPEELAKIEALVNDQIKAGTDVITRVMPIEEARKTGAMALFGEKYDDEVRVVSMGTPGKTKPFSVELCGGTHVKNTREIGAFKIVSEGALSSGIRRLEAVTGTRVDEYLAGLAKALQAVLDRLTLENKKLRDELAALGGKTEDTVPTDPQDIEKQNRKLVKEISDQRLKSASQSMGSANDSKNIAGMAFIGKVLEGFPAKDLKPMADDLKKKLGSGVIVLVATDDGKASIVVAVTDDLIAKVSAVDLVKIGAAALGGQGGGGRPDMAQAGGPNAGAANDGVAAIEKALSA